MIRLYVSLLVCAEDMAYTGAGVSDLRAAQTLITIRGCLAIAQDFSITPANLCVLIFMGSILLHMGGLGFTAGFLVIFSGPGLGGT